MQIQMNSDHHITGSPQLAGRVQALVRDSLERLQRPDHRALRST